MLENFDIVIDGFTYNVRSFDREDIKALVYRVQINLAEKESPDRIATNIGGDFLTVAYDNTFDPEHLPKLEVMYGRAVLTALKCNKKRKVDYPDLVQMV
jgi:hypothetical protein